MCMRRSTCKERPLELDLYRVDYLAFPLPTIARVVDYAFDNKYDSQHNCVALLLRCLFACLFWTSLRP